MITERFSSKLVFGIDLGTTNSAISQYITGSESKVIKLPYSGKMLLPSCVMWKDGEYVVGEEAYNNRGNDSDIFYSFKKDMGTDKKYEFSNGEIKTAVELSALVLKKLKDEAEKIYGVGQVKDVVISTPAYFNSNQKEDTKLAGQLAGLNVVGLINEPTAALLAYKDILQDGDYIVYDLGGGTFDATHATVNSLIGDMINVNSTIGDNKLGGDDIDHMIAGKDADNRRLLMAKHLKESGSAEIEGMTISMVRKAYKTIVSKTLGMLSEIEHVEDIILVGGSTKSELLRDAIGEIFENVITELDPDLVVSQGAAVYCAIALGLDENTKFFDVISQSIGVAVEGGRFSPIIDRDSQIPAVAKKVFEKTNEESDKAIFSIYQGNHNTAEYNTHLGDLVISDVGDINSFFVDIRVDMNNLVVFTVQYGDGLVKEIQLERSNKEAMSKIDKVKLRWIKKFPNKKVEIEQLTTREELDIFMKSLK